MKKSELSNILNAGGSISVDAEKFFYGELKALARAATKGNATLTIKNPIGYSCEELIVLCQESKGHICFPDIKVED